jgi:hypothetical protein
MASEIAEEISELFDSTANHALAIDAELQEVRAVLAALRHQYLLDCWCDASEEDEHKDSCTRAHALLKKLEVK